MSGSGATPVTASALRRSLRRARRRSGAAKPIGDTLQDLYVAAFAVLMVAVVIAPTASRVLADAGRRTATPGLALTLAVAAAVAGTAAALRALTTVGPVVRDPADVTWLLASPTSRSALLAPGAALLVTVAGGIGAVLGAACGVVAGVAVTQVLAWAAGGAAVLVTTTALAVAVQRGRARNQRVRRVADAGALAALALLVVGLTGRTAGWRPRAAWPVVGGLAVLAAVSLLLVPRALPRLRRSELVAGAGLALGLRATVTALDGSFVAETLRTRRLLERAVVRRRRLAGDGLSALVAADARRVGRSPRALLGALALAPVAWALADLYGRLGAAAAVSLAAWGAAGQVAAGLRTVSRSGSVSRSLPFSDAQLRGAHAVVPGLVALVVTSAATGFTARPAWTALAAALVGTAAVLRTAAGRSPISWGVQATSPLGSLPVGAVTSYLVGLDVAVVSTVPLLLGAGPRWGLAVPALACLLLVRFNRRPA